MKNYQSPKTLEILRNAVKDSADAIDKLTEWGRENGMPEELTAMAVDVQDRVDLLVIKNFLVTINLGDQDKNTVRYVAMTLMNLAHSLLRDQSHECHFIIGELGEIEGPDGLINGWWKVEPTTDEYMKLFMPDLEEK